MLFDEHLERRFLSFIEPTEALACWLWQGQRNRGGYGCISMHGQKTTAHRVSYMLFVGEIPPGAYVCHGCDVRACVNPHHLWIGDASSNALDAFQKGRKGTLLAKARLLTVESVREIRRRLAKGEARRTIAADFGVVTSTVSAIDRGENWRGVG